jgi:glycerol-3-phosphate acyltransferase PlsY
MFITGFIAVLALIVCYLVGSIPTAYILVKWVTGTDVRTVGSGNVGATNAGRLLGRWGFITVLVLDALKGFIPVFIMQRFAIETELSANLALFAATGVIIGHAYTIFLDFKGGKGVATGLGVFLALAPLAVLLAVIVFVVVVLIFRMISLGSMLAAIALSAGVVFLHDRKELWVFTAVVALFVIIKHRSNISRIFSGTENKIKL